jgi:malonyl CoA-acyl carrier protein transacylase/SAM-dependent methyltransferase
MFTGQGAHFAGMGRTLYDTAPVFRETLDRCAAAAKPHVSRDLREALFDGDPRSLEDPLIIQPANFAFQVALAELWRGWGVKPVAAIGHSLGEYAAAHMAGVFNLEDAMALVAARGRGAALCHGQGAMVAVSAPHDSVMRAIGEIGELELAAYNGPQDFVVSGAPHAVEALAGKVQASGGKAKILAVPFGSHSRWVEPALPELDAVLARVSFSASRIALAANPTGALAAPKEMSNAAYWRAQMRQTVRFASGIEALAAIGITHFIETGPHPVLCAAGAECLGERVQWLASMRRESGGWDELLASVQRLFVDGAALDWRRFDRGYARQRVAAPTYPFQRVRHWIDAVPASSKASATEAWKRANEAAERQSAQGPLGLDATSYPRKWDVLERITRAQIVSALCKANLFQGAMRIDRDALLSRLGVAPDFQPLVQRWLNRLVSAGDLERDGEGYFRSQPLTSPDVDALWSEAETHFADNKELLAYVRHCASLALDVVTGRESPLETLFPGGSFALAEDLYERSATMRYINALAASAVATFAAAASRDRMFRVLEVGGGTGATTVAVMPSLPPGCSYHFSDVSDFFLEAARKKFASHPEMRFAQFDLDIPLEEQGYADGQFDLILAANAVHASADLAAALARLRRLLAPGGLLALVESTKGLVWFDVTTGLIEGWRQHMDELRADGPLLSTDGWARALTGVGFAGVASWPAHGSAAEAMGQHLILARAPGDFAATAAAAPNEPKNAAADSTAVVRNEIDPIAEAVRAAPAAEQLDMMRDFVRAQVMSVLRLKEGDEPGRQDRLTDLGLDSLMAVQLRNRLSRGLSFEKPLPATVMFDHPTIEKLAIKLLSMLVERGEAEPEQIGRMPTDISAAKVARMSDADIERLLAVRGRR